MLIASELQAKHLMKILSRELPDSVGSALTTVTNDNRDLAIACFLYVPSISSHSAVPQICQHSFSLIKQMAKAQKLQRAPNHKETRESQAEGLCL